MNLLLKKIFRSHLLTQSFWVILGSFFNKGINFISIAWIARGLGPELFGEYNVIQSTVGMLGTFAGLGLGLAATKLIAENNGKNITLIKEIINTLFFLALITSITIAILFFFLAPYLSTSLLNNEKLTLLFRLTTFIVILDSLIGVQNGIIIGLEDFRHFSLINILLSFITSPLLILGSLINGLTGLTIAIIFSKLINFLINKYYLNNKFPDIRSFFVEQPNKKVLKKIFNIGIPSFFSSLSTTPINWIATSLFVNQVYGYQALGVYNTANQLRTLVLLLPDSAGKVTMPQLASAYSKGDFYKFKRTVIITFFWNLLLSVLPAVFLFLFSDSFLYIFGEKFFFSFFLIKIILLTGILIALNNAIGYIFICSNLIWYDFLLRVLWGITLLCFIFFYGRFNGADGYAVSTLLASLVHIILQILILILKFKIKK